jgi:hypothetical protein
MIAKGYKGGMDEKENQEQPSPYMRVRGLEKQHLQRHGHAIVMNRGRPDDIVIGTPNSY